MQYQSQILSSGIPVGIPPQNVSLVALQPDLRTYPRPVPVPLTPVPVPVPLTPPVIPREPCACEPKKKCDRESELDTKPECIPVLLETFRKVILKFNETDPYNTYLEEAKCNMCEKEFLAEEERIVEARNRLQTFIEEIVRANVYVPLNAPFNPMTGERNEIYLDTTEAWAGVFCDLHTLMCFK